MNHREYRQELGLVRRFGRALTGDPVEYDLRAYRQSLELVARAGERLPALDDRQLRDEAALLRGRALEGEELDRLLPEAFALTRELAHRVLGMRPFDVQVLAGVAIHRGRLVEMLTGEGKTLAAVLPAALRALGGQGVHVLTFNDYLARRDARWMGPIFEAMGVSVGTIQEGMEKEARRRAYAADVTYGTAKEVGFDFLRASLARREEDLVQRPFNFAIVDEADSILIDEARVPLVIASSRETSGADPHRIAEVVGSLEEEADFELDEYRRNVQLTDRGINRIEAELLCGSLHDDYNGLVLAEVNQALHARVLLRRDVDYIVRDERIELVDEFTGRVVADRRWPDGLHRALEAKEALAPMPASRILGSITLQHFLSQYPHLSGMTATARPAADELRSLYDLKIVVIPPNRACVRVDLPDLVFTHREARDAALLQEIAKKHEQGRPVLVGTSSVEESEQLNLALKKAGIPCRILNAKNDEVEAEILAESGALGAVTISTNMAGRGTDIRLGGSRQDRRDQVAALGGLCVIGTNRHESRRIDDQLRGRAGRQADPGSSRFFVSLEDPLMVRFGIDTLIPKKLRPKRQDAPIEQAVVLREVDRLQRIVEGQNQEIRKTLARYSDLVEQQRAMLADGRLSVLLGETETGALAALEPGTQAILSDSFGADRLREIERDLTLHHLDEFWARHLELVGEVREWIHLVGLGGKNPLHEFHRHIVPPFEDYQRSVEELTAGTLAKLAIEGEELLLDPALAAPSSTWTYLVNDQARTGLDSMLFGHGSTAFSAVAVLTTWPLLLAWAIWRRLTGKRIE